MEITFLLQMKTSNDILVSCAASNLHNGLHLVTLTWSPEMFLGLVAKYYVVDRVKDQCEAFTRGLWEVIDPSWLRIFNEPELQVLISGPSNGKIDVADLRANCRYAGGFTGIDPVSFTGNNQRLLDERLSNTDLSPSLAPCTLIIIVADG